MKKAEWSIVPNVQRSIVLSAFEDGTLREKKRKLHMYFLFVGDTVIAKHVYGEIQRLECKHWG